MEGNNGSIAVLAAEVPSDLHKAVRLRAIERNESLKEFIIRAVTKELEATRDDKEKE